MLEQNILCDLMMQSYAGVKVDLPVLTEKDIHDLKDFACRHKVDYVAASFVQSAADVRFIRSVLDEGGGAIPSTLFLVHCSSIPIPLKLFNHARISYISFLFRTDATPN